MRNQRDKTIARWRLTEKKRDYDTERSAGQREVEAAACAAAAGLILRQNHRQWRWWLLAELMTAVRAPEVLEVTGGSDFMVFSSHGF